MPGGVSLTQRTTQVASIITQRRAKCPACDTGFTYKATKPKRYCSEQCQGKAADARKIARRRVSAASLAAMSTPGAIPAHSATVYPWKGSENRASPRAKIEEDLTSKHRIGDRVRIWIDDAALGSGERYLIVTEIGTKRVRLYSAAAVTEVTVGRDEFERYAKSYGSNPETVLAILERNLNTFSRHSLDHDKPIEVAIARIKEAAQAATAEEALPTQKAA